MFRDRDPLACALRALDRRNFAEAAGALSALLEQPADDERRALLHNKRGVARMGLELREAARADFDAALVCRPRYAPALTNLGNLLLESGDIDAAIVQYERAIESDAEYAVAYLNLGVAYKRAGKIVEGVRALRHAQRLEDRRRPTSRPWYPRVRSR